MSRRAQTLVALAAGVLAGALLTLALPLGSRTPPAPTPAPRPVLEEVPTTTLLAWTPSHLPEGFAAAARTIPGVHAVTEVRSGTAWLDAWGPTSQELSRAPGGLAVPVEVAAVDPSSYLPFVPPEERAAFEQLAIGVAVLGASGAELRGIDARGVLVADGSTVTVAGVVDDSLIGAHEAVVSNATGAELGIDRTRYLLVALEDDVSIEAVEAALREAAGIRVRVRGPGETPEFRHGDAVLPPVQLKELFGEFAAEPTGDGNLRLDDGWVRDNIETIEVPVLGSVRCHRALASQLGAAFAEIARRGLDDLIDPDDSGGCFSPRFLSQDAGAGISHHSWGVAIDLNVSENPFGAEPRLDERVVEILERWGLTWGGRWLVPDAMHFEFLRFPLSPKG